MYDEDLLFKFGIAVVYECTLCYPLLPSCNRTLLSRRETSDFSFANCMNVL